MQSSSNVRTDLFARAVLQQKETPILSLTFMTINSFYFPVLNRLHMVNEANLIIQCLHLERGGSLVESGFKQNLAPLIDIHTMILSPFSEHRRLRTPFEKFFTKSTTQSKEMLCLLADLAAIQIFKFAGHKFKFTVPFLLSIIDRCILKFDHPQDVMESFFKQLENLYAKPNSANILEIENFIAKSLDEENFHSSGALANLAANPNMNKIEKIKSVLLIFSGGAHTTYETILRFIYTLQQTGYGAQIYGAWKDFISTKGSECSIRQFAQWIAEFVQKGDLLQACYLEILRLFPIFPCIKRTAVQDFMLKDRYICAGDEISLNVMAAQRDPNVWGENPHVFNPDRFSTIQQNENPRLLAFGMGSQGCIGKYLAESEIKVMAAVFCILLQQPDHPKDTQLDTNFIYNDFSLRPKNPIVLAYHGFNPEWQSFL